MQKGVAGQKLVVFAFDATTNLPKVSDAANLTAYVSKDFGAVTQLADTTATEADATNAPGLYLFDLAQAETNADTLLFSGKSATSNVVVIGCPACVFTTPANFSALGIGGSGHVLNVDTLTTYTGDTPQTGDAYARLGAPAGASVSADVAAVKTDTAAVKTKTDQLTFTVANHVDATASLSLGTDAITAASVSAGAANKIADSTLRRTSANVEASADGDAVSLNSLYGTTRMPLRYAVSGTTLSVYKSDGTLLGTLTLTETTNDATANLVTGAS